MTTRPVCRCEICGAVLINTPSGAACPEDLSHGRLKPPVPGRYLDAEHLRDRLTELPKALAYDARTPKGRKTKRFRIDGLGGFRRFRHITRLPDWAPDHITYASIGDRVYPFVRDAT